MRREKKINGPFIESKAYDWKINNGQLTEWEKNMMSNVMTKCKNKQETKAKAMRYGGADCLFIVENRTFASYILSLKDGKKWDCNNKETVKRWDAVTTFKPPPELSIESGNIVKVIELNVNSEEYQLLAQQFLSTTNGVPPKESGLFGGIGMSKVQVKNPKK